MRAGTLPYDPLFGVEEMHGRTQEGAENLIFDDSENKHGKLAGAAMIEAELG